MVSKAIILQSDQQSLEYIALKTRSKIHEKTKHEIVFPHYMTEMAEGKKNKGASSNWRA
jgi:hypothetical protein